MNMHIFIIINILQTNKTVDFVIHLTRGEDHKVMLCLHVRMLHCSVLSRLNTRRKRLTSVQMALPDIYFFHELYFFSSCVKR